MSDSQTPHPDIPEPDGAPVPGIPAPDGPSAAESAGDSSESAVEGASPAEQEQSTPVRGRSGVWVAVALLCVALGTLASVLGAIAVAHSDESSARRRFHQGSAAIASTLSLAIRHEEQLTVSASTYFADHPKAAPAEFDTWMRWARTHRRYPELDALGLLKLSDATPALGVARDTARSIYTPIAAGGRSGLAIETPVYRGSVTPRSVFGRRAASVGWLREVLIPGVMLGEVLRGHPGYAVSVRYGAGSPNVVFAMGASQSGGQSATSILHDGWVVTSFGPAARTSVFTDGDAFALLIGGIALSVLFGLLVDVLAAPRPEAPAEAETEAVAEADTPAGESPDRYLYEPVTGLPNRELTLDRAERMVARTGRDSGMLAGALFVDIDQLREVNEKLGQEAGNQLLKIVGERLEDVVRTGDTVGRLDGDEFVVLVESAARGVRLDSLAQRMIEALHKPVELDAFGPGFVLTASIGVAFGRYETHDDLLRDAHVALASAKAAGKDRYTLFNANMRTVIEGRAVLEAELSTALAENQFFLLYQPIYDLRTRKVAGLEALIRWQHPAQGVLRPDAFIPLAEETGLIVPIGRFMLESACARAAAWDVARSSSSNSSSSSSSSDSAVGPGGRIGVSVRVSAHQLSREGFATDVRRALLQSGIEPSLLTLQIPETAVIGDLEAAGVRLRELKALGVGIAIDDFGGSGYAHQADLRRLPLDALRVDRRSLAASEDESYRGWLLEAILLVGRELELMVIATGIETHEQMDTLQTIGCTMAQGALLGKPAPVGAVASLFDVPLASAPGTTPLDPAWPGPTVPPTAPTSPVPVAPASTTPDPAWPGPGTPASSERSDTEPSS
ncbi:MAG: EAL domain-containing protein [Solirubrobacteraceae bacterium]